jgi:hypothetical protein
MVNLLVTGGCGFIGSNFINYMFESDLSINIVNIDAMYYCASETNICENFRTLNNYKLEKGNLCDFNFVKGVLENNKIDTVIHFAAQSHVQNSFSDSLQYSHDNVLGTHTLLEACRLYGGVQKFIHISTDEVYGESMLEENENKKVAFFLPTRKGSERVENKNTRRFADKEGGILQLKIEQLLQVSEIPIIISTNDEETIEIANKFDNRRIKIVNRPDYLCQSFTIIEDFIKYIPSIVDEDHIFWVHATSPFVEKEVYEKALEKYFDILANSNFDSLIKGEMCKIVEILFIFLNIEMPLNLYYMY